MKKYMTSFGVPIVSSIEGGNEKDLQKSISKKVSSMRVSDFQSLNRAKATEREEHAC